MYNSLEHDKTAVKIKCFLLQHLFWVPGKNPWQIAKEEQLCRPEFPLSKIMVVLSTTPWACRQHLLNLEDVLFIFFIIVLLDIFVIELIEL